ncbi:hypothetical protein V7152_10725 [Neobacillus drentensis]|uniref:hypothetical protein n=1 Tax=Neobacillus drentensis TaxID=220684 RepID=UPI0030003CFB
MGYIIPLWKVLMGGFAINLFFMIFTQNWWVWRNDAKQIFKEKFSPKKVDKSDNQKNNVNQKNYDPFILKRPEYIPTYQHKDTRSKRAVNLGDEAELIVHEEQ